MQAMVTHGRVELLAHPLSQKYLQMKWNAYGKYFHVTNLVIYTVFLFFVTLYASELMQNVDAGNVTHQLQDPTPNSSDQVRKSANENSFSDIFSQFFYPISVLTFSCTHPNKCFPCPFIGKIQMQVTSSLTSRLI